MCAFNPSERLTIEQALAHPWFKGSTLSSSDAGAEFIRRKSLLEEAAKEAQEEKRSQRASRERGSKEKKVSRGEGDENKELEALQKLIENWTLLETPDFNDYCLPFSVTRIFTTADPVETFRALVESIEKVGKDDEFECKVSDEKLKAKYKLNVHTEYEEEGEEESKEGAQEVAKIEVSATVCKQQDSKYCVDFVLVNGPKDAFVNHFKQLMGETELASYNNATSD